MYASSGLTSCRVCQRSATFFSPCAPSDQADSCTVEHDAHFANCQTQRSSSLALLRLHSSELIHVNVLVGMQEAQVIATRQQADKETLAKALKNKRVSARQAQKRHKQGT